MKVAYLITAYGDFRHLERLVDALDDPRAAFFIHVDAKSPMPAGLLAGRENVAFAPRRRVWWGGWSHTAAILSLMEMASRGDFDYCVVMSGADYPVRSNETIYAKLAEGGEFINAAPGFRPDKPEGRVKYYRFDGFDRRGKGPVQLLFKGAERALKTLGIHKRRYPFPRVYAGVVWSALSMGCVRHILDHVEKNPRYVSFFRTSAVPEEMFFQTIVGNSPFAGDIKGTLTYMDWDADLRSPAFFSAAHLPKVAPGVLHEHKPSGRRYEKIFARKFNDHSGPLLDEIDAGLRKL